MNLVSLKYLFIITINDFDTFLNSIGSYMTITNDMYVASYILANILAYLVIFLFIKIMIDILLFILKRLKRALR